MVFELGLVVRGVHVYACACVCLHMLFLNIEFAPSCLEEKHMEKRGLKKADLKILHRCIYNYTYNHGSVQVYDYLPDQDREHCQHPHERLFCPLPVHISHPEVTILTSVTRD